MYKPTVVFPYVEAGLGHIMPITAVSDAFINKYGKYTNVVRTKFFQDSNSPEMQKIEQFFVKDVKAQNKNNNYASIVYALLKLAGTEKSVKALTEVKFRKGLNDAMSYVNELNPDLVLNTHFVALYYFCKAKEEGLIDAINIAYCPDPIIGLHWDKRVDTIMLSSEIGKEDAVNKKGFAPSQVQVTPFLLRKEIANYNKGRQFYRKELGLPLYNFTILLADGAYGAGKLKETVYQLLKSKQTLTIIAACGKNEELYEELKKIYPPSNITLVPYGFTDKMLMLSACCDLFIGKAGASNLAEPAYFYAPQIITMCASPIEDWICAHFVTDVKSAIKETNIKKVGQIVEKWAADRSLMKPYEDACVSQHTIKGADVAADIMWDKLCDKFPYLKEIQIKKQKETNEPQKELKLKN